MRKLRKRIYCLWQIITNKEFILVVVKDRSIGLDGASRKTRVNCRTNDTVDGDILSLTAAKLHLEYFKGSPKIVKDENSRQNTTN